MIDARRHDLDALRATAMLLGILLHATLSFFPIPGWPVQDSQQNDWFSLINSSIHGFRMPLFFLISGFFTAMLWQKRGLKELLWHRFRRIFLPLVLGVFTIVPIQFVISAIAIQSGLKNDVAKFDASREAKPAIAQDSASVDEKPDIDIRAALEQGDLDALNWHIANGEELNGLDPQGYTLLNMAAFLNKAEAIDLMVEGGANVNQKNQDQGAPLHTAAFMGNVEAAQALIKNGADVNLRNGSNQTPIQIAAVDWGTTQFIAGMLQIEMDQATVEANRATISKLLLDAGAEDLASAPQAGGLLYILLFQLPIFMHLWFLAFLCWLVAGFSICVWLLGFMPRLSLPNWLILSPVRYLWLIPAAMIPQWFMADHGFGPETAVGLLPLPQILGYYAIFFGFGALYYNADDQSGNVGRFYWLTIPISLLVVYPLYLHWVYGGPGMREWIGPTGFKLLTDFQQVAYAWLMTFGAMKAFRLLLGKENRAIRYLSDSSYWLYLAHLPLIIGFQLLVRDWEIPAVAKMLLICAVSTGILLFTYEYMVRYTWIGRMLNGPRQRPAKAEA